MNTRLKWLFIVVQTTLFTCDLDAQTITLVSPNGGEHYAIGDTMHIRWTTQGVDNVILTISFNGGLTDASIRPSSIRSGDPGWGDYPFVIPNSMPTSGVTTTLSDECVVIIVKYGESNIADESDDYFFIRAGTNIVHRAQQKVRFPSPCNHAEGLFSLTGQFLKTQLHGNIHGVLLQKPYHGFAPIKKSGIKRH